MKVAWEVVSAVKLQGSTRELHGSSSNRQQQQGMGPASM
jgi:hypothetical protein